MRANPPLIAATLMATLLLPFAVRAQTAPAPVAPPATNVQRTLAGLAPFSALLTTDDGRAALAANLEVTGAIQTGISGLAALQPFPAQQVQALRDASITDANALQLADGLGSALGAAYVPLGSCVSADDGPDWPTCTMGSASLATLFGYASHLAENDSEAAKYAFGNETAGNAPKSSVAKAAIARVGGTTDVTGKAYLKPACRTTIDPNGDSRPFQTEPQLLTFSGMDYFGKRKSNLDYLCGPIQDLRASPSFPSGHTTYGYTESLLLAVMVPERYAQMVVRAAEYGNGRIVIGAHYAMDVLAGRTIAEYDLAHLLAGDPAALGQTFAGVRSIVQPRAALTAATTDLRRELAARCGHPIAVCARNDRSRFRDDAADAAFYESTQTYGLPAVYPARTGTVEDVAAIAPEAGTLLTAAFPRLTLAHADRILTATEGPGGGFLDDGSAFGLYSRLDLYRAAREAAGS